MVRREKKTKIKWLITTANHHNRIQWLWYKNVWKKTKTETEFQQTNKRKQQTNNEIVTTKWTYHSFIHSFASSIRSFFSSSNSLTHKHITKMTTMKNNLKNIIIIIMIFACQPTINHFSQKVVDEMNEWWQVSVSQLSVGYWHQPISSSKPFTYLAYPYFVLLLFQDFHFLKKQS